MWNQNVSAPSSMPATSMPSGAGAPSAAAYAQALAAAAENVHRPPVPSVLTVADRQVRRPAEALHGWQRHKAACMPILLHGAHHDLHAMPAIHRLLVCTCGGLILIVSALTCCALSSTLLRCTWRMWMCHLHGESNSSSRGSSSSCYSSSCSSSSETRMKCSLQRSSLNTDQPYIYQCIRVVVAT